MFLQFRQVLVSLALATLTLTLQANGFAARIDTTPGLKGKRYFIEEDGIKRTVFEHEDTGATIDFVTNSGICETTPGVNQYSGYISVGKNMSMWFWFFEARHEPETAPFALWLNGGPGCSSMLGLFEENGPCKFSNNESTPSLNPYSYNEYANMLYVDQPIGTGFSYGDDTVNSTVTAAPYVWKLLQVFFANFPQYECRDFGLFTESYGGHYGPEFADYFQSQNAAICDGHLEAEKIDLVALGINNGWYDASIQEKEYINFSRYNSYYPLINESTYTAYLNACETQCLPALQNCTSTTGQLTECNAAQTACDIVDTAYGNYYPSFNAYDIRQPGTGPSFPPDTYVAYLHDPAVMKAIGARSTYTECPEAPSVNFWLTADSSRSFEATLSSVVQSGITTVMFAGDADSVCDWFGGLACANAVSYPGAPAFRNKEVANYTVNGEVKGTFKSVGKLSWLRVFDSGHEVPAFQPELALQVFKQTMQKKGLFST